MAHNYWRKIFKSLQGLRKPHCLYLLFLGSLGAGYYGDAKDILQFIDEYKRSPDDTAWRDIIASELTLLELSAQ